MELATAGLEQWSEFRHTGHRYNISPNLPKIMYSLGTIIHFIQLVPVLWASSLVHRSNILMEIINEMAKIIIYLDFLNNNNFIIFLFATSILFSVAIYFILFTNKVNILNPFLSYSARSIFEFLTPIFMFYSFSALQNAVKDYLNGKTEFSFVVLGIISSLLFFSLQFLSTVISSFPLAIDVGPFTPWTKWSQNLFRTIPPLVLQMHSCVLWNEKYGVYIVCSINVLLCFFLVLYQIRLPFIKQIPSFIYISVGIAGIFFNIMQILTVTYPGLLCDLAFFIDLVFGFIAIFSGNKIYDKMALSIIPPLNRPDTKKYNEVEYELEEIQDDAIRFPPEWADKSSSIDKLYALISRDPTRAKGLANFLIERSESPLMVIESARVLILLKSINSQVLSNILEISPRSVPFYARQLLCDLQYEAIGKETSDEYIEPLMNSLQIMSDKIRKVLLEFIDSVLMDESSELIPLVDSYMKACQEFEALSSLYIVRSPNSAKLARSVAEYYQHLKGDFEYSQLYQSHATAIKESDTISSSSAGFPFAVKSSRKLSRSSHSMETSLGQRFNAQHALSKVHSRAVIGSAVTLVVYLAALLFSIFYSVKIDFIEYISKREVMDVIPKFSEILLHSSVSLWNVSTQLLTTCDPSYEAIVSRINDTVVDVFHIYTQCMIIAVQNITKLSRKIEENVNKYKDQIKIWSDEKLSDEFNITLQYMLNMIVMMDHARIPDSCSGTIKTEAEKVFRIVDLIFDPSILTQIRLLDFMYECEEPYQLYYYIFFSAVTVVNVAILISIYFFTVNQSKKEDEWFWSAFLEVDTHVLESLKQRLKNSNMISDVNSVSSTADTKNILSSDEIEDEDRNLLQDEDLDFSIDNDKKEFKETLISKDSFIITSASVAFAILTFIGFAYGIPSDTLLRRQNDISNVAATLCNTAISIYSYSISGFYYQGNLIAGTNKSSDIKRYRERCKERIKMGLSTALRSDYFMSEFDSFSQKLKDIFEQIDDRVCSYINGSNTTEENLYEMSVLGANNTLATIQAVMDSFYENWLMIDSQKRQTKTVTTAIFAVAGFIFLIIFVCRIYFYQKHFDAFKSLILLPSTYSSTISTLLALFYPKTYGQANKKEIKFQSRYIVKQSVNAIVVVDGQMKIQDVNKATVEMLRFNKESLIREDISTLIINPADKSQFEQQYYDFFNRLQFLGAQPADVSSPQNEPKYNLLVRRVDNTVVPVSCIMLSIGAPGSDGPAYAIILRDRTAFLEQERAFKEAQNRVESLLLRILPRVMATKLMSNNPNLFSKVDKATIIFIAIADFLDWCGSHSHVEIMQMMDVIFSKFDKKISKFPTLVKIKVINGVYMAAGGLFNEISEFSHEIEAVKFALQCGQWAKRRNKLTGSNIHLQIGINTGGPIIAGILGIDKPLFDIWGDAVNVSARLETSADVDTIQMLQETASALPVGVFKIHERQGVFLKGKGVTSTYVTDIPEPDVSEVEKSRAKLFSIGNDE